jgi:hypothetical protein
MKHRTKSREVTMTVKRSKTGWSAPKSGGYSARSTVSGRFVVAPKTKIARTGKLLRESESGNEYIKP